MRTLKFRQYYEGDDDSNPEWNYFDLRNGKMVVDGGWKDPQQFTGLTDRSGVEIYGGDIVKVVTNHIADLAPKHPETTSIVEVKFENAMFRFGDMTMNYFPLREAKLEVIGNIYENPELVKCLT